MRQTISIIILLLFISCKKEIKKKGVKLKDTNFELSQINYPDIKKIEEINNGIEIGKSSGISLSKSYFPEIDKYEFDQPIIYKRDTTNSSTSVSYFFTKKDSIVRLVEYSWYQNSKKETFIDSLYQINKRRISKILKTNGTETYKKVDYWWQKENHWDNDSIHVFSFIFGIKEGKRTRVIIRYK
ncbi:hypothetical protein [uncultured Tenacibaculum sp.]|uniref:hypothetical protein n=1 Tax=uncultured Tenacibaculum sp. TaxID=174713 RepID=UPI002629A6BD|nr:hypothetical protein [uncultured Tenacibaculum sp.]